MSLFIAEALADGGNAAVSNQSSGTFFIFMVFLGIFYLLMLRPQYKRAKEHRSLIGNLAVGDEVITNGGLLGKIAQINDNLLILLIAPGVEIQLQKVAITAMVPKGTLKI